MDLPHSPETERPPQIGMIVLEADETLEPDFRHLLPAPIEVLASRVPSGEHVTEASLSAMDGALGEAAGRLPKKARFAAIGYGCTSGTAQIGAERVHHQIRDALGTPDTPVSDPMSACIAACRALGLSRLGLVSPYVENVSARLMGRFEAAGLTTGAFGSFNVSEEARVVRIDGASLRNAALRIGGDATCEAVFLSCTNLRTLTVIAEIETALGKPVLSSNQVLAWHLARLSGVSGRAAIPGRLGQV